MKIKYFEEDGELRFSYEEKVSIPTKAHAAVCREYKSSGRIPKKIQEQGEQAIKKYAERKVKADVRKQKVKDKKRDQFAKNPNFPVSVEYNGEILKGKIISADDSTLRVRLEEPYQGEDYVIYGFISAMSGRHIFDKLGNFSGEAIATAQRLLIGIYKEKKHYEEHKEVIDLAKRLTDK